MRPLKSHFPDHALTTLDTLLQQTKAARVFRRAQAVREVVAGHHINAISEAFHLANSALRKWEGVSELWISYQTDTPNS